MDTMPDVRAMEDEHKAWLLVGQEWRAALPDADMNAAAFDPLIRAVEVWAEFLVELRLTQTDTARAIARRDKFGAYLHAKGGEQAMTPLGELIP